MKKDLNYHVRAIHQKIRPFKCDICKTKFAKKQNLHQHISAVHEKIKAFQCDICELKFSVKLNLNIHIETVHENVLRFKCNICNKDYASLKYLNSHKTVVHNQRSEECLICGVTLKNLKKHIRFIHGPTPSFSCQFCEKKFKSKQSAKNHQKRFHENHLNSQICGP